MTSQDLDKGGSFQETVLTNQGPTLGNEFLISPRILTTDNNYFVSPNGNDGHTGATSGKPLRTIQRALDIAAATNFNGHYIEIDAMAGTYNEDLSLANLVGAPDFGLTIVGNKATPSSVIINSASGCVTASGPTAQLGVYGLKFICPAGSALFGVDRGYIDFNSCEFGDCTGGYHMVAVSGGNIQWSSAGDNVISGNAIAHIAAFVASAGGSAVHTVTLVGTPHFSDAFVVAEGSEVDIENVTFVGPATGKRFRVDNHGHITPTFGSSLTYLPGDAAGICDDASAYNGFSGTSSRSLGIVSSGTIIALDVSNTAIPLVRQWFYTNNGAHTFPAPTMDGTLRVLVTNGASAGTITFTGFTTKAAPGDALDTVNGHMFLIEIFTINSITTRRVYALQ